MMFVSNTFNILATTVLAIWIQSCACRSVDMAMRIHHQSYFHEDQQAVKPSVAEGTTAPTTLQSPISGSTVTTALEDYGRSSNGDDDDYNDFVGADDDEEMFVTTDYTGYDIDEDDEDDEEENEYDYFIRGHGGKTSTTPQPPEPWKVNEETVTAAGVKSTEGLPLFEGDIVLDPITRLRLEVDRMTVRRKRAVKKASTSRWANRTVPYLVSNELSHSTRKEIRKAIRHWRKRTCLQFRLKQPGDVDYVHFVADEGCWSNVGRMGGEQNISIGRGCRQRGTIIHEIGHAVGFWHEQARRDRDIYIRIMRDNIQDGHKAQFRRMPASWMNSMGFAYDYWSIMHYGPDFFSRNNSPTIKIRKIGRRIGATIGQRHGLSHLDVAQVNAMYQCNSLPPKRRECFRGNKGRDYRGKLDYTDKGITCQHWSSQWPHAHNENLGDHRDGLGSHNHCRNPGGRRKRPWCYTTLTSDSWQYCDIKSCD